MGAGLLLQNFPRPPFGLFTTNWMLCLNSFQEEFIKSAVAVRYAMQLVLV